MQRVVGIDSGYVNFAICCLDTKNIYRPTYWKNEPLFTGKFSEERLAVEIYQWITKPEIKELLDTADLIVLERQMVMKFQAINHCIRFRYFAKTMEVNPVTVGKFFNLPEDRRSKKKSAVEIVSANLPLPVKTGKKDDLCDAYLLAAYAIFQERTDLRQGWLNELPAREPRKRKEKSSSKRELEAPDRRLEPVKRGKQPPKPIAERANPTPAVQTTAPTQWWGNFGGY